MEDVIKIDTTKLEDYVLILEQVIDNLERVNDKLNWYARDIDYRVISSSLNTFIAQIENDIENLKKNKNFLKEAITRTSAVETLLARIDPLDYEGTVKNAEYYYQIVRYGVPDVTEYMGKIGEWIGIFVESLGSSTEDICKSLGSLLKNSDQIAFVKRFGKELAVIKHLLNFNENMIENENVNRAIAEFLLETAIDVAIDAALGIFGFTTFPASLIFGGVCNIAMSKVDDFVKLNTDSDGLSEWVTDMVLDNVVADWA